MQAINPDYSQAAIQGRANPEIELKMHAIIASQATGVLASSGVSYPQDLVGGISRVRLMFDNGGLRVVPELSCVAASSIDICKFLLPRLNVAFSCF